MKTKHFILIIAVLAVGIILLFFFHKHKFSWYPSFKTNDTEPYGCMIFDSIMSSSMKGNYQVLNINPDSILCMKEHQGKTVLCLFEYLEIDPQNILNYTKKGGHVILACDYCNYITSRELGYDYYFMNVNREPVEGKFVDLTYLKDKKYNSKKYTVSECLIQTVINQYDYDDEFEDNIYEEETKKPDHHFKWKDVITALIDGKQMSVMKTTNYGKGKITLLSMPLLLTNYGILENNNSALIMRIFSQNKNMKMVRTSSLNKMVNKNNFRKNDFEQENTSLLEYILSETALKTALYLALLGIALFFFFGIRRKQRIIPVIKPKQNGQLEFIKQIGGLYKRRNASDSIIMKKYTMMADKIMRKVHVDIKDQDNINDSIMAISNYTGLQKESVQKMIYYIDAHLNYKKKEEEKIFERLINEKKNEGKNEEQLRQIAKKQTTTTNNYEMMKIINYMNIIEAKL